MPPPERLGRGSGLGFVRQQVRPHRGPLGSDKAPMLRDLDQLAPATTECDGWQRHTRASLSLTEAFHHRTDRRFH